MALVNVRANCGSANTENPCCQSLRPGSSGQWNATESGIASESPGDPVTAPTAKDTANPISVAGQAGNRHQGDKRQRHAFTF